MNGPRVREVYLVIQASPVLCCNVQATPRSLASVSRFAMSGTAVAAPSLTTEVDLGRQP
jgi:hypothetical protein